MQLKLATARRRDVEEFYADGGALSDHEFKMLNRLNPEAWSSAICEQGYRDAGKPTPLQARRAAELMKRAAARPPEIIPRLITTASHLKGERRIAGIASSGAIDSHNQALCPGGANITLPVPLLIAHDWKKCIGSVEGAEINSDGKIFIWANLDSRCDEGTWRRLQSRSFGGLSVAADRETLCAPKKVNGIDHYFSWRLKEVSICETGANHECVISLVFPLAEPRAPEISDDSDTKLATTIKSFETRIKAVETMGHDAEKLLALEKRIALLEPNAAMLAVTHAVQDLKAVMEAPVVPIFNAGKVVGAQRAVPPKADSSTIAALHQRIDALENSAPEYKGVWAATETYRKNDICTHGGALWWSKSAGNERPGQSAQWQLCCKAGRDGRDAK